MRRHPTRPRPPAVVVAAAAIISLALAACSAGSPGAGASSTAPPTTPATPTTPSTPTTTPTTPPATATPPPTTTLPAAPTIRSVSSAVRVTAACSGSSGEVENAADPVRGYVYEDWIGCGGIGFARSLDGGRTFRAPVTLPGSGEQGSNRRAVPSWDPAIAVAPDGTVYAAFMVSKSQRMYPVVDVSHDHGSTFSSYSLAPKAELNWGDRDFVAVDGEGHVFLSWDYGPSRSSIRFVCPKDASCGFTAGEVNAVVQESGDGGRTWGPIVSLAPGFPRNGGDAAPIVLDAAGRVDVVFQRHAYPGPGDRLGASSLWFASAAGAGKPWSAPVRLGGPGDLTMNGTEWWIDGDAASDAAGNLYATWDTQSPAGDVGWLAYSTDHGGTWSKAIRVTPDDDAAPHVVQVAGGAAGVAYVAWLTDAGGGWVLEARPFSIAHGFASAPVRISSRAGADHVWPGDTFGISVLHVPAGATRLALTWGGAVAAAGGSPLRGDIWAAVATVAA